MQAKRKSVDPFSAKASLGLLRGYSEQLLSKDEIIKEIQNYQDKLIHEKGIYLSVSISDAVIVLSGQVEPHLTLNFINYPRFPIEPEKLKEMIEDLIRHLMAIYEQNRVVVEYLDETAMLEVSESIDPRIK